MSIRKDIDTHNILEPFHFPEPFELKLRLKDMLEDEVDEKYYLSDKMIEYIVANNDKWTGNNGQSLVNKDIASTINTGEGSKRCDASNYICEELPYNCDLKEVIRLGGVFDRDGKTHQAGSVYDTKGLSPTLTTMEGGYRQPCILIKNATKKGYLEAEEGDGIDISGRMEYHRGNVQKGMSQTLSTAGGNNVGVVVKDKSSIVKLRIRKLTPKECFRLMGFEDDCVDVLIENGISNTQLYKQAGNSIVVDVLEEIFVELLNLRYIDLAA